jgi:TolB-like protein
MLKHRPLILIFFILLFTNCSSIVNKNSIYLPKDKIYAISSFWNYTETPMAGLRASSIIEGVISKKNLKTISLIGGSEEMESAKSRESFIQEQKAKALSMGASYLIIGSVQEWRYKTGIDGEPVVSYTLKIIDLKSGQTLFNGVGAKSGWGHKSIGVVAQEIAQELIPNFM